MVTDEVIGEVLSDWNSWDAKLDPALLGHERDLTKFIRQTATGREIVSIVGVRRCGKTTILYQLMKRLRDDGVDARRILYVNLEDHRFARRLQVELLDDILRWYGEHVHPSGPLHLFIDEPQEVQGWERWVRGHYDRNPRMRMYASGSSSRLMDAELSTLLTGRNLSFAARPFSFREFLSMRGVEYKRSRDVVRANLGRRDLMTHELLRYMQHGGFPEAIKREGKLSITMLLQQYFDDIITKDVVRRHGVRNPRRLRELAVVLMSSVSNLVSLGRLARSLGTSASQIGTLIDALEDARLVTMARCFSHSMRESVVVQKPRKVFAVDTGLRNAVAARTRSDQGWLAENLVFGHLAHTQPTYWKDTTEVDLVMGGHPPIPVNVSFGREVPDREFRSLEQFHERHGNTVAHLITRDRAGKKKIAGFECVMIPLWGFLLTEADR